MIVVFLILGCILIGSINAAFWTFLAKITNMDDIVYLLLCWISAAFLGSIYGFNVARIFNFLF